MNLLKGRGPSVPRFEEKTHALLHPADLMLTDEATVEPKERVGLAAFADARALVRLIQCAQCSLPFRQPVTLPCGHSWCRACLPEPHIREHISYPDTPDRRRGVRCPQETCRQEHPIAEVNLDVTLSKVMERISAEATVRRVEQQDSPTLLQEVVRSQEQQDSARETDLRSKTLHGGRLLATFTMAEMGALDYSAEVSYKSLSPGGDDYHHLDEAVMVSLRHSAQRELDCHVCWALVLDPVTTPCGHTLCRKCLARVLDHASSCPVCRRTLLIPPSLSSQPSNQRLVRILGSVCPDVVSARAQAAALEERGPGQLDTPIFVCTLSYPSMPTWLRIFEPRYRLMVRRAWEGSRQFGMVMYNRSRAPQGELGVTDFVQYGTMLRIVRLEMLPNGESIIETRGLYRFRVCKHELLDGYVIGRVERIEDISMAEEERREAEDIRMARQEQAVAAAIGDPDQPNTSLETRFNELSTRELMLQALQWIERVRPYSPSWLATQTLVWLGPPPDDPALFPYWFTSVVPLDWQEGYKMLYTTSVRERLKLVVSWIPKLEASQRPLVLSTRTHRSSFVVHGVAFAILLLALLLASRSPANISTSPQSFL